MGEPTYCFTDWKYFPVQQCELFQLGARAKSNIPSNKDVQRTKMTRFLNNNYQEMHIIFLFLLTEYRVFVNFGGCQGAKDGQIDKLGDCTLGEGVPLSPLVGICRRVHCSVTLGAPSVNKS